METVKSTVMIPKPGGVTAPLSVIFKIPAISDAITLLNEQPDIQGPDALLYMLAGWDADMPLNQQTAKMFIEFYPSGFMAIFDMWTELTRQRIEERFKEAFIHQPEMRH